MVAALTYFADQATFSGFTPAAARTISPTLDFNASAKAKRGEVSIRVATKASSW